MRSRRRVPDDADTLRARDSRSWHEPRQEVWSSDRKRLCGMIASKIACIFSTVSKAESELDSWALCRPSKNRSPFACKLIANQPGGEFRSLKTEKRDLGHRNLRANSIQIERQKLSIDGPMIASKTRPKSGRYGSGNSLVFQSVVDNRSAEI